MFGTLRLNAATGKHQHVKLSEDDDVDARGYTLVACDVCRVRKLKCNGDRSGCGRCKAASPAITCTYTTSSSARTVKRGTRLLRVTINKPQRNDVSPASSRSKRSRPSSEYSQDGGSGRSSVESSDIPTPPASIASPAFIDHAIDPALNNYPLQPDCPELAWDPNFDALLGTYGFGQEVADPSYYPPQLQEPVYYPDFHHSPPPSSRSRSPYPPASTMQHPPQQQGAGEQHYQSPIPGCECLHVMAQMLEDTNSYIDPNDPSSQVNTFLIALANGTQTCSEILGCTSCNSVADNSTMMATVAWQLSTTATSIAQKLSAVQQQQQQQQQQEHNSQVRRSHSPGHMQQQSAVDQHGQQMHSSPAMGSGLLQLKPATQYLQQQQDGSPSITIGQYRVENPKHKHQLLLTSVFLHLGDLQILLANLKQRTGMRKGGAWRMLEEAEQVVASACWMLNTGSCQQ